MQRIIRRFFLIGGLLTLNFFLQASIPKVTTGTWGTASNMSGLHDNGCSVLLQDGRLLVGGGSDASGPIARVDIFNTDGTWSSASSMLSPRAQQACAVLQSGDVLVAGGTTTGGGATNSAELYDPNADTWTQLGTMMEPRSGATASLLQDGRVLLGGGRNSSGPSSTLEIFDPSLASFSFAGTMSAARQDHAAALLNDGRVLLVGGSGVDASGNPVVLASSDIYDPSSGTVSPGPALAFARSKHSATTQLDGQVVVIGGSDGSNDLASIEVYDPPVGGNFAPLSTPLASPRSGHLAFLLPKNNEVLVVGGQSAGADVASAELYVPWGNQGAGAVQSTGTMAAARSRASGAPLSIVDGLLLVAGGSSQTSAELYSFATVKTDQSDYAPGTTVTITGSGWQPGETVTLTLVESPLIDTHPALTAVADANGNIFNNQFSPDSHDANVRFYLTATGSQSQAQNTFTDAPQDSFDSSPNNYNLSLNPGQAIPGGTSVTYTVTQASGAGAKHTTFPVTAAVTLQGSFGSLNTGIVSIAGYTASGSVTLSGRVPCNQAAGPVTLKINADASVNPNLSPNKTSTPINITVGSTPDSSCVVSTTTTIIAGSGQTIPYATAAANPLVAQVSATGSTPTGTASLSIDGGGPVDTETLDNNGRVTFSGTFTSALAVGTHSLHVAYVPASGSNFAASSTSPDGSVTITKAAPVITWTNPADITYGTALGATQLNAIASVPGGFVYSPAAGTVLNAGSGQTLSTTFTPTDTTDYNTANASVQINVLKASQTITFGALADKTYGDAAFTVSATGGTSGNPVTFATSSTACSISGATVTIDSVGTCALTASQAGNDNYNDAAPVTQSFTINSRPLTVTADPQTKVYGDADPGLTYKITSGTLAGSDSFTGSLTRAAGENVGTYAIDKGTLSAGTNYTITFVPANLTITPRAVTATADAQTRVYGDADPALTYKITSGMLVGGDSFSGSLTRAPGESVGTYAIQQGTLALSTNYSLTYAGANLTITPRPITATADAKTKVYGENDPALTYQVTGGSLVFSDVFSGALTRAGGENVGTYAIQQGTLALSSNYTLTYGGANLSITARPITVTADGQTKVYGEADPALTYKITSGSLAFSDAFTGGLSRAAGENVATYAIQQGTLTLGSNYNLTFVAANLTITARPITVTADAQTKVYGSLDPALTYKITTGSVVTGDSFTGALTRAAGEDAGTYAIQQGTLTLGSNYNLTFVGANLTITKADATIVVKDYTGIYDGTGHGASGTAIGVKGEDLSSFLDLGATFTDVPGGTATWTFAGNINYKSASGSATIAITQADASITVNGYTGLYDGNAHGATGSAKGVKGEDLNPLLSLGASFTNVPGGTANWSFAGNVNYKPASGSVDITITKAPTTTTVSVAGGATFTYDSYPHPATVSVTGAGLLNLTPAPVYSCNHAPVYVADSGCTASYTYLGDPNHTGSSDSKTYTIAHAPLSVTANNASMVLDAALPQFTGTLTGVLGTDGITATYITKATGTVIGTFSITPVLSDPNNRLPNYAVTTNDGTLTVQYAAAGGICYGDYGHQILAPIAANGTSTFKQGSTIPAKFRVCDALGNSISALNNKGVPVVANFNLVQIVNGTFVQTVDQIVASTTPDTAFRWDATSQQWIFNISTSNLAKSNTYYYLITLNDGSSIAFQYGLPK